MQNKPVNQTCLDQVNKAFEIYRQEVAETDLALNT